MANWLARLFIRSRTRTKMMSVESLFGGLPISTFGSYESYLKAVSGQLWASWKALDIVGNAVRSTPYKVVKIGKTDPVTVQGLSQLLLSPNPTMNWGELLYLIAMHVKATGNSYLFKSEATLGGDRPKALIPMNPKRVEIKTDTRTGEVIGYMYTRSDGMRMPFDVEEVIHIRRPNPNSDYYGLGDIEAAEPLFNDAINRDNWATRFWKNGAAPSGLLVCEDNITDEEEWEKAKRKFQREYGGSENSGKTAWLTGKWRYEQIGLTAVDMQDLEKRRLTVEEIFNLHGVPLSIAGVRGAANYATAELDRSNFAQWTVMPLVALIEEALNSDLVAGYGLYALKFDVTGLMPIGHILPVIVSALQNGIVSINEARRAIGLPANDENPDWNQHFISSGLVPIELSGVAAQDNTDAAAKETVAKFIRGLCTKGDETNGHERERIALQPER